MRRVFEVLQGFNLALSVLCVVLFVAALVSGEGVQSFAFLIHAADSDRQVGEPPS